MQSRIVQDPSLTLHVQIQLGLRSLQGTCAQPGRPQIQAPTQTGTPLLVSLDRHAGRQVQFQIWRSQMEIRMTQTLGRDPTLGRQIATALRSRRKRQIQLPLSLDELKFFVCKAQIVNLDPTLHLRPGL